MPSMFTSDRSTSGGCASACASPVSPSAATVQSNSPDKSSRSASRMVQEFSTMRTLGFTVHRLPGGNCARLGGTAGTASPRRAHRARGPPSPVRIHESLHLTGLPPTPSTLGRRIHEPTPGNLGVRLLVAPRLALGHL